MKYLLDANVFIEAKNRYYAFDICPGFWDWMDHVVQGSDVVSITMVRDELLSGNDKLSGWVAARRDAPWFLDVSDANTQTAFGRVARSVQAGNFTQAAKAKFLAGADPWLVAKAASIGATLVTHEVLNPNVIGRIPIPNICRSFQVPFMNTFDVLRALSAAFIFQAA